MRRVLPWQGFLCRRAIEDIRSLRTAKVENIYGDYMVGMCEKLRAKVNNFFEKKLEECNIWASKEREVWEEVKINVRNDLSRFINTEITRQRDRDLVQKKLQKERDMTLAVTIENTEKKKMEDQVVEVVRLCQGASEKMDARALHVTIGAATVRASVQATVIQRGIVKKQEAAFEWLRCVADNALTVEVIEYGVKKFLKHFRREKKQAYKRLEHTKQQLEKQYSSILKIIDKFCKQVVKETKDHTTRERLISQGFSMYLVEVNAGRLNTKSGILNHTISPQERDLEIEHTIRRAERNCKYVIQNRSQSLKMLDKVKSELIQLVTKSYKEITQGVMSDVFSHREADVQQYLSDINRVLRKVVQISCNTRRKTQSDNTIKRSNFFRFEDECLVEIGSLMANLRFEMDEAWRTEHLLGVKINHKAQSRLDELIAANEEDLKSAFNELSCFLEGERSNVHWVDVAADTLAEKNTLMIEKIHNLRVSSHYKWIVTLRKVTPQVHDTFDRATKQLSGGGEDECGVPIPVVDCFSQEFNHLFATLEENMAVVEEILSSEHDSKESQEVALMSELFQDMRDFIDSDWKDNVIDMNNTLSVEVGLFLKKNAEFKEYLADYNLMNEIEMYVFEQSSSNRLERYWSETYHKNSVFADELKYTLNKIIKSIEREQARKVDEDKFRKIAAQATALNEEDVLGVPTRMKIELGSSEAKAPEQTPNMTSKLNSSERHNFSAVVSASPQTFNVARNLRRMSLVTALHVGFRK